MTSEIEQAVRNAVGIARWWHPTYGAIEVPFPWEVMAEDGHVTIIAADGQVLISDTTHECDPAFWSALVDTLNTLAVVAKEG